MAFSRQYSVADSAAMEAFRTPDGLAMIRHYPLNEHVMKTEDVGYFVADFEEAGPYCMLAEARALANGDPRYIGYMWAIACNVDFLCMSVRLIVHFFPYLLCQVKR
jgi:hypothetical protein